MEIVYRVEQPGSEQGLWYTSSGVFQPIVHTLGLQCAAIPMDPDNITYRADGISWISGCREMPQLLQWFPVNELIQLRSIGFKLMQYETEFTRDHYGHVLFSKEHGRLLGEYDLGRLMSG